MNDAVEVLGPVDRAKPFTLITIAKQPTVLPWLRRVPLAIGQYVVQGDVRMYLADRLGKRLGAAGVLHARYVEDSRELTTVVNSETAATVVNHELLALFRQASQQPVEAELAPAPGPSLDAPYTPEELVVEETEHVYSDLGPPRPPPYTHAVPVEAPLGDTLAAATVDQLVNEVADIVSPLVPLELPIAPAMTVDQLAAVLEPLAEDLDALREVAEKIETSVIAQAVPSVLDAVEPTTTAEPDVETETEDDGTPFTPKRRRRSVGDGAETPPST